MRRTSSGGTVARIDRLARIDVIVTFGNDLTPRSGSDAARLDVRGRTSASPRWSRRRGVVAVVAGLAAIGLTAGALAPLGASLALAQEPPAEAVSVWADARPDAQELERSEETAAPVDLVRGEFTVYVTPKPTPTPDPVAAGGQPVFYTGGGSSTEWLTAAGIPQSDWGYVDFIVSRESGWNPNATNRSSGACGLVQAYPCSKVPGSGYDPVDNLTWANGYAVGRYGSWAEAYAFWTSRHWW